MESGYSITRDDEFSCMLNITNSAMSNESLQLFFQSIMHVLPTSYLTDENMIHFVSSNFVSLSEISRPMSALHCTFMVDCLSKQIMYLKKYNIGFYGIDLGDVIVIDECYFCICNPRLFSNIIGNKLRLCTPIKKPKFCAPELKMASKLPVELFYQVGYYSIGLLILHCLNISNENEYTLQSAETFHGTKLYWFVKRCIASNPEDRRMLFI